MYRNRALLFVAPPEIVALQHPGHGHLARDPDHLLDRQRGKPLGVEPDLGPVRIEDLEDLFPVGLGVSLHVFPRQGLSGLDFPRGVADHPREVPDEKHHLVSGLLEMLELLDENRVPQVQVGSCRVEPRLHAEGSFLPLRPTKFPAELLLGNEVDRPAPERRQNRVHASPFLIVVSLITNASAPRHVPVSGSISKKTPATSASPEATSNRV